MKTQTNPVRRLLTAASKTLDNLQFSTPLLTRLIVGVTFFYTGRGKLGNLAQTTSFFADLGIPFPAANALFISSLEFFGGICLIAGFGTRIFSALLASTMVVALLTADKATFLGKFPTELTDVGPAVLFLFLAWLVLFGGGAVSLDRLASRYNWKIMRALRISSPSGINPSPSGI